MAETGEHMMDERRANVGTVQKAELSESNQCFLGGVLLGATLVHMGWLLFTH